MEIVEMRAIEGPNIYSSKPVIKVLVDVKDLDNISTRDIPGFNQTLLSYLPGLSKHHCSFDEPGGFLTRLKEGTYFPHVLEHISIELLNMSGQDVAFGKARRLQGSLYTIIFGYKEKTSALRAGRMAVKLVKVILKGQPVNMGQWISELKDMLIKGMLGPSTQAIYSEVLKMGIPVTRVGEGSFLIFGYGKYQKRIQATISQNTSCLGVDIACDKELSKELLSIYKIPVPYGKIVDKEQDAILAAKDIGYPVVIKPKNGNQGKGVSLNLKNSGEVLDAYKLAKAYGQEIIVEKHIPGRHYRILVVNGRFCCASERKPAHVVGDGVSTIAHLIDKTNKDPLRGEYHEKPLTKIKVDPITLKVLDRYGYNLETVPNHGEIVYLRENGNLSTGGTAMDVTQKVCPENRELSERVASIIGLDIVGIDITTKHISIPVEKSHGAIIEVNAAPGIRMHLHPSKGKSQPAAKAIADMLFPKGAPVFPLAAVTGTNGKTTTVRMLSHILKTNGLKVGMTTTDGTYIDSRLIIKGDCSGPESARAVLLDPGVEAAVLEVARGGLIRAGLAYQHADVGIITNITEDHLGQDGINTIEDMVFVKSLVAEQVKTSGYAVLNADDPMMVEVIKRIKGSIILFSDQEDNIILRKHLAQGGKGVYVKNGTIYLEQEGIYQSIGRVKDMPSTLKGRARHNIQNALAATAGVWGLNIPPRIISRALKNFRCDEKHNPGRMNIITIDNIKIMLDYAHNVKSMEAIINTCRLLRPSRIVGVIASPGNRRDQDIINLGYTAGKGFHRLIIKEDISLRGRKPGQVASLLERGALDAGLKQDKINVVLNEMDAIAESIAGAREGDLIVIFYEKYDESIKAIKESITQINRVKVLPV
ncbi:MAG TPA: cyanophycin synthetase [Thermoanaerobacterales bacterium]|nr:cyanophycin synthetase [Thermoanaerobacterales bacterium]